MSKSRRLGTTFESDVVRYLNDNGFTRAERRALSGVADKGDINLGIGAVVLECKNEARIDLAGYMGELDVEIANADALHGFAVVKRRGKNVAEAYAVTPLRRLVPVMHHLTRGVL